MSGDLKLVGGLWVHICTRNIDFLVILTKMKHIFLHVTTNICYNNAKPYTIHQRGHLLDKKNLSRGKWVKYGPFNSLVAVAQTNDFFSNLFALPL